MTLNKKELTLGHAYYYRDSIKILEPYDFISFLVNPERYSGIPLTAEILTDNLGFEQYKDSPRWKRKANWYDTGIGKYSHKNLKQGYLVLTKIKGGFLVDNFGNKTVVIKNVHGMQNFWYTLTTKELEFKTK